MSAEAVSLARIPSPVILSGDASTAYRDPAVLYIDGVFHLYCTVGRMEPAFHAYLGYSHSTDLIHWSEVELLSPRDRRLNYSSPGNVVRYGDEWLICLQTYPTPNDETFGNETARIWIRRSVDLVHWSEPELLRVKGPDVPRAGMGRMIDPYLLEDKDQAGKWWCFYKQRGVSLSWTRDMVSWHYVGHRKAGENVCVLVQDDEYVMFHSPANGVGVLRSSDLLNWRADGEPITLGQDVWPWAQGRLTAGFVLDLRDEPGIGCYLMFYHGSSPEGKAMQRAHGHASLALAWSSDLRTWHWPGKD